MYELHVNMIEGHNWGALKKKLCLKRLGSASGKHYKKITGENLGHMRSVP